MGKKASKLELLIRAERIKETIKLLKRHPGPERNDEIIRLSKKRRVLIKQAMELAHEPKLYLRKVAAHNKSGGWWEAGWKVGDEIHRVKVGRVKVMSREEAIEAGSERMKAALKKPEIEHLW